MKRVCRKVASTTDFNLHQGTGATRRSVRARARSTYLLSSRALLRRDGGIENRAGARADVVAIILSSAKGGREGGGENDFFKGREREWQENLDDWAGGAVRAAAAVVTFTRSKGRGTRGPPRDEDFLRKSR